MSDLHARFLWKFGFSRHHGLCRRRCGDGRGSDGGTRFLEGERARRERRPEGGVRSLRRRRSYKTSSPRVLLGSLVPVTFAFGSRSFAAVGSVPFYSFISFVCLFVFYFPVTRSKTVSPVRNHLRVSLSTARISHRQSRRVQHDGAVASAADRRGVVHVPRKRDRTGGDHYRDRGRGERVVGVGEHRWRRRGTAAGHRGVQQQLRRREPGLEVPELLDGLRPGDGRQRPAGETGRGHGRPQRPPGRHLHRLSDAALLPVRATQAAAVPRQTWKDER